MPSTADRVAAVRARISRAASASDRQVRLIAVSKRKPVELIREAYVAGQRDFGENYVQELVAKAEELRDLEDIRWHMIGHLQRNKVRHVVSVAWGVHTVDSIRLAEELGRRAEPRGLHVLVEVNVSGVQELHLVVGDAESDSILDHADWADVHLLCAADVDTGCGGGTGGVGWP